MQVQPTLTLTSDEYHDSLLDGVLDGVSKITKPGIFGKKPNESITYFLAHLGLEQIETLLPPFVPSGACQFSSICHQLFNNTVSKSYPHLLRAIVCDYLLLHQTYFTPFLIETRGRNAKNRRDINMESFLNKMSINTTDGNAITMQAIADITRATIKVLKSTQSGAIIILPPVLPRSFSELHKNWNAQEWQVPGRVIWLTLVGEAHYRSLAAIKEETYPETHGTEVTEETEDSETTCAICIMSMQKSIGAKLCKSISTSTNPICQHTYHLCCIMQWSSQTNTCPECRTEFGAVVGPTVCSKTPLKFAVGKKKQGNVASYTPFDQGDQGDPGNVDLEEYGLGIFGNDLDNDSSGIGSVVSVSGVLLSARRNSISARRRRMRAPVVRPMPSVISQNFGRRTSSVVGGSGGGGRNRNRNGNGTAFIGRSTENMGDGDAIERMRQNFENQRRSISGEIVTVPSSSSSSSSSSSVPIVPIVVPTTETTIHVIDSSDEEMNTTQGKEFDSLRKPEEDDDDDEDEDTRMAKLASMAMEMEKLADAARSSSGNSSKQNKSKLSVTGTKKKRKAKLKLRRNSATKQARKQPISSTTQHRHHSVSNRSSKSSSSSSLKISSSSSSSSFKSLQSSPPLSEYQKKYQGRLRSLVLILEENTMDDRRTYMQVLQRKQRAALYSDEDDFDDDDDDDEYETMNKTSFISTSSSSSSSSFISPCFPSLEVRQTLVELKRTFASMSVSNGTSGSSSSSYTTASTTITGGLLRILLDCGLLRALKRCLQPLQINTTTILPEKAVHLEILLLLQSMELIPKDLKTTGSGLPKLLTEYARHQDITDDCSEIAKGIRSKWISLLSRHVPGTGRKKKVVH